MFQSPNPSKRQEVRLIDGRFVVDAQTLATAFQLDPAEVQELMRNGQITSRHEVGTDKDAGRIRLSFFFGDRVFRLTVNQEGDVLARSRFDVPGRS